MRWIPIALPLMLALAFLIGWLFPDRPEDPLGVARGGGGQRGLVLRPGESTVGAVRFLRTLRSDPAPPPTVIVAPPAPPPPPPPPPPDISVTFKARLGGIVRDPETGQYGALVRDAAAGGPQIATMTVGDGVGDGWRIRQISSDSVTLGKGRESRTVRLYE